MNLKNALALAAFNVVATPVLGCAVCDSEVGVAVRAGIFNDTLPVTLLKVLAPFPILALAIFLLNRYLPD